MWIYPPVKHSFKLVAMANVILHGSYRQQWPEVAATSATGFFPEDMSPVVTYEDAGESTPHAQGDHHDALGMLEPLVAPLMAPSMAPPIRPLVGALKGPQGPVPFLSHADDDDVSLFQLLQRSSVSNTPIGTPTVTPRPSPVGSPQWRPNESLQSASPVRLSSSTSSAAFLPPEFYLDNAFLPGKPPASVPAAKRSRSLIREHHEALKGSSFSLPLKVQPHVECTVTENAIGELNLLEEEITRVLRAVQI